jgi:hypothetical protein
MALIKGLTELGLMELHTFLRNLYYRYLKNTYETMDVNTEGCGDWIIL